MFKILFALTLGSSVVVAQTALPAEAEEKRGSISGVVKDESGSPIELATVGASINFRQAGRTTTDAQGRYELADLSPARYRIFMFRRQGHGSGRKIVTLAPGQALDNVDFLVVRPAEITGRVLDQNDEPVAGVQVHLIGSEYQHGALQHRFRAIAKTDDRGEYRISHRIAPGVAFRVLAKPPAGRLPAVSDVPADLKLRRPARTTRRISR